MQVITKIIENILTAFYQPFWFAMFSAVLLTFFYLYADHPVNFGKGVKLALRSWLHEFMSSVFFRKLFLLSFFTVMILFRTLLNRNMWENPLSDIMGGWWIWKVNNGEKQLTTECFENLLLMLPFTFLLFWTFSEKILESVRLWTTLWKGIKIAFLFSFTIEMLQLFLRLGTWQLSDLFYNTVGGGIGGLLYFVFYKIKRRSSRE